MEDIQNLSTILYDNFYGPQIYLPYLFYSSVSMHYFLQNYFSITKCSE
jgi:hypothetical protein